MKMSNVLFCIVCTILAGVVLFVLNVGMSRAEVVDCIKWQDQAKEYPNFYLLQWQADQCEAHNISIDAPIK